jgi:hypothetical protein
VESRVGGAGLNGVGHAATRLGEGTATLAAASWQSNPLGLFGGQAPGLATIPTAGVGSIVVLAILSKGDARVSGQATVVVSREGGEICDDGTDNNGNNLIDCQDQECADFPGCGAAL